MKKLPVLAGAIGGRNGYGAVTVGVEEAVAGRNWNSSDCAMYTGPSVGGTTTGRFIDGGTNAVALAAATLRLSVFCLAS